MDRNGFALIEAMVAMLIVAIFMAIATPYYLRYRDRAQTAVAISEIKYIEKTIYNYFFINGVFPDNLADIGMNDLADPWGNPYQYLCIDGANISDEEPLRKDIDDEPVNSDFDLYSMGADGMSQTALSSKVSQDDIVRISKGSLYGKVSDCALK